MKKLILLQVVFLALTFSAYCQYSSRSINPSYRYVSSPGFVNITELNGATGLSYDELEKNSKYYYGLTNVFGYQISRNFFGGLGVGYLIYDGGQLVPLYLEYRYSLYLRGLTPFFYADGGAVIDPVDFKDESKIFLNPGIGFSRYISSKFEGNLSVGFNVQARSTLTRVSFVNFKLGIIFRNNPYRMFRK